MDLLSGFLSSSIAVCTIQPLDTLKIQFQSITNNNNNSHYRIPSLAMNIYKTQGIRGFYKGSLSMMSTYPIFWSTFFYMKSIKIVSTENLIINSIGNTAIASSVASVIANPLFVLKTRKQTDLINNRQPTSYFQKINGIYLSEGISGYFKGINATLISNCKLGLQFPLYDYILYQTASTPENIIFASFISKLVANSIFYPTDIIRTIQRDSIHKKSIMKVTQELFNKHGIRGFYRGILIYNGVSCPNFVIMMFLKEKIDKLLK